MNPYLLGVTPQAFARGNRRLITAIRTHLAKTGTTLTWKHGAATLGGTAFLWPAIGQWAPAALTTTATVWTITAVIAGQATPAEPPTAPTSTDAAEEGQPGGGGEWMTIMVEDPDNPSRTLIERKKAS